MTAAQWQAYLPIGADRSRIRRAYAEHRTTARQEYDVQLRARDMSEAAELALTDSPLIAVVEAGYNELPLRWKEWVEGYDATDRPLAKRFALAVLRRTLIRQLHGEAVTTAPPPPKGNPVPGRPAAGGHGEWVPAVTTVDGYIH